MSDKHNQDYFEELQDDIRDTCNKLKKLENRLDKMSRSDPKRRKVIRKIVKLEEYLDELNKEMREERSDPDGAENNSRDKVGTQEGDE